MRKLVNLSVRVPGTLNRLVERKAVKDGIPKSEVIRIALIRYLVEEQSVAGYEEKPADLQGENPTSRGIPPQKETQ